MVERGGRRDHAVIAELHDAARPEPTPAPPLGSPELGSPSLGPPPLDPPPEAGSRKAFWRGPKVDGPLRRSSDDRVVAGVAAGLARRFGLDPTCVRIAFALFAIGGTGLVAYVGAWLFLRRDDEETSIAQRSKHDPKASALAIGLAALVIAVFLVLRVIGLWFAAGLMWPLTLAAGGLAIIWQQADEFDRSALRKVTDHLPGLPELGMRSRRAAIARTVLGVVLVAAGVGGLFALGRTVNVLRDGVVAAFGVIAGFALVFGPLWLRLVRQLADEHRQRVVSQERADIAAHLHDSVLQTLALIQRRADDPREVTRLARAQERDLRSWLFEGRVPGQTDPSDGDATFARALAAVEREVESTHGVTVDAVTVGDCPLDEDVAALVAAGREAAMNAARWSGADTISLFAEVEPAHVSLFVRDRGVGFDEAAIGADRRGVAESIRGRVTRHGGTAFIRTAPGAGTEVALTMPRRAHGA